MTQEEKQLLIQDLCARLPYEIIVDIKYSEEAGSSDRLKICSEGYLVLNTDLLGLFIEDEIYLKPYLHPMSSMTEEEKIKLYQIADFYYLSNYELLIKDEWRQFSNALSENKLFLPYPIWGDNINKVNDWLNAHHFDYHGLIEKGLAIEAPKGMYN